MSAGSIVQVVLPALGTVIAAVIAALDYQNRRSKLSSIRSAFSGVVDLLAADDRERQLAGAILLRRFLDPSSEFGLRPGIFRRARAPYAEEALSVMAAVLRGVPRGDLQKLLADGLAHAATLEKADLQRTNLQNAYLAPRSHGGSLQPEGTLAGADFYRADLSGASLKGANACGAAFYQARLQGTVMKDADLRDANFFEAELSGADFSGALLEGALFEGARNIPPELLDGIHPKSQKYTKKGPAPAPPKRLAKRRHVFLSTPSDRTPEQDALCIRLREVLASEGLVLESLNRSDYPPSAALAEISRRIAGCSGMVVLGLRPVWSDPTVPSSGATPWTHIEAGMAYSKGLPLLLLREPGVDRGVFDEDVDGYHVHIIDIKENWDPKAMRNTLAPWVFEVLH